MENIKPFLSVVSPVYRSADSLRELVRRLGTTLSQITNDYEIILVNDSSPGNDWEIIRELAQNEKRLKGLSLSRNFGQHNAIFAGLQAAQGEWVVVMDCDLQDQPEEILKLYAKATAGYEIVLARRQARQDNFFRKFFSTIFYRFLSYLTETNLDGAIANFGIYNKSVIRSILRMNDHTKYFPAMISWVGYRRSVIDVVHTARPYGATAYSYRKLFKLACEVMLTFSNKPLKLVVKSGLAIAALSLLMIIYYIYLYWHGEIEIMGWASLILSLWFLAGVLISVLGVVGLYVGKIFDKVKDRPNYIISDSIN